MSTRKCVYIHKFSESKCLYVALIMGVARACRGKELVNLIIYDVSDLGNSLLIAVKDTKK